MDIRKVKKLIEMLEASEISEIEIHEGEESVRISKQAIQEPVQTIVQVPATGSATLQAPSDIKGMEITSPGDLALDKTEQIIKAPMVGIFYESATPGSAPFVEVGQEVNQGDVLCVIEAMKIMNQIESDINGVVKKIFVENGEPVEYGQPLFQII